MLPPGFERLLLGHAVAVARSDLAGSVRGSLLNADGTRSTLHEFASRQPGARPLPGRAGMPAYAITLPSSGLPVVVRHNRRGGVLGPLLRDRFLAPTRAPRELEVSLELVKLGVPTPEIVAYALYPPGGIVQRSDVCSREIPGGRDLATILVHDDATARAAALATTAGLLSALARAGARHHDLNAKNVLIAGATGYVLDVDRVTLGGRPQETLVANMNRLGRSLRKWRDELSAQITEREISELHKRARDGLGTGPVTT